MDYSNIRRTSILLVITVLSLAIVCLTEYAAQITMPKFTELSSKDSARLDQQRAIVAAAANQRYGATVLTKTVVDLPVLQRLIDDKIFRRTQTYQLQSLGVAFGDVLASTFALRWVMVTDEYGTDPTLRLKSTSAHINALTMISKRIENGETVDLRELLDKTREQLAHISEGGAP